jgi:CMP-2-keto-3-deoxyoctulosonic acid synthetase
MAEGLEQNRWLENGRKIRCVLAESQSIPVDTLIDLQRVRELMPE